MAKSKLLLNSINESEEGALLLPNEIMNTQLGGKVKMVYAGYKQYNTRDLNFIAKKLYMDLEDVKKAYRKLIKLGWIIEKDITPEEIKDKVLSRDKLLECEWCHEKVLILNEHHYPVPKRLGGTDIVNICPNCHYAFHSIEKQYGKEGNLYGSTRKKRSKVEV